VTLAIAGFRPADLDITAQQNLLVIQGRRRDEDAEGEMVHVGIANRGFERRFELADFVRVERADLADGLLVIDLVREVPDAMRPKKIAIGGQPTLEVVADERKEADAA
jgi:molecular chaperone IbpA